MRCVLRTAEGRTVDVEVEPRGRPAPGAGRLAIGFDPFRADFRKAVASAHNSATFGVHAFDLELPGYGVTLKGATIVGNTLDEVTIMYLSTEPLR
jgi:hypothetical protein